MTAAVIVLALLIASTMGALLVHVSARITAERKLAQTEAQLAIADANVASFKRQIQRYEAINHSLREVNDAVRDQPVLGDPASHGLDRLLATLDVVASIGPSGGSPSTGVPGGAGSAPEPAPVVPRAGEPVPAPKRGKDGR